MDKYILYNGKFVLSNKAIIDSANRGLNYGDGFFETLKWHRGEVLFFSKHIERIKKGFKILQFENNSLLNADKLEKEIAKLIVKNNSGNFARVRIIFFRDTGGYYPPENNTCSYIIQTLKVRTGKYPNYSKGKILGVYDGLYKSRSALSTIKSLNSLVYVLAALHAKKNKWDDCFILNDKQKVVDAISSSVILIKNDKLHFSPKKDGGVDSVMKHVVQSIAIQYDLKTKNKPIRLDDLKKADEILICNVSRGIEWVSSFSIKKYKSKFAKKFQEELNYLIS